MRVLGIDCGKEGALALIDTKTEEVVIEDAVMKDDGTLDCNWCFRLLMEWQPTAAAIEQCFRPQSLVRMEGSYQAVAELLSVTLYRIPVTTWKRSMVGQNTNNKGLSISCCQQLFPSADINRLSPIRRKPSPNADRAEALLIAAHLRNRLTTPQ